MIKIISRMTCVAITLLLATPVLLAAPFVSAKGYSLTPVPGWKLNHSGLMNTDCVVFAPPSNGFSSNLSVLVGTALPGETLRGGQKQITTLYGQMFTHWKLISSSLGSLAGLPALQIVGSYQQGIRTLRMRQVIVLRRGHVYTYTCTMPDPTHLFYDSAFAQMLGSVRWSK